jgi:hypothetical protein
VALPVIVLSDGAELMIDRAHRKAGASAVVWSLGNFDQLERVVEGLKRAGASARQLTDFNGVRTLVGTGGRRCPQDEICGLLPPLGNAIH